tara:strand:- start:89 stop:322 length:234 start_codon:yes stop_codon:yes gene_type:complete
MALVKQKLIDALFAAETADVKLTKEAETKVKSKCEAVASAIDDYIKSADVDTEVNGITATQIGPQKLTEGAGKGKLS